jgi:hypothetical protein
LLDGLSAHPAWLFNVVSHLDIRDGETGQHDFFRSLLGLQPVYQEGSIRWMSMRHHGGWSLLGVSVQGSA